MCNSKGDRWRNQQYANQFLGDPLVLNAAVGGQLMCTDVVKSAAEKVPATTGTHCRIHLQPLMLLEIKVIKRQKHESRVTEHLPAGSSNFTDLKICFA